MGTIIRRVTVRYKDIAKEIDNRIINLDVLTTGIERFIVGLGKKAIIANTMAEMVDSIWANSTGNTCGIAWLGSIAYTLQIYFDFSGYSDMAIGLGKMFGFNFNENFNLPYISKNISEFWRRWHISLSSWFRDYVYIPLGGNRKNVYLNLAIVFVLTGIWHGASWHYIVWGVWNGTFILIERLFLNDKDKNSACGNIRNALKNSAMKAYTLIVVNTGWVIFRAPHTSEAITYIQTMLGILQPERPGFTIAWFLNRWTLSIMIVGIFFSSSLPKTFRTMIKGNLSNSVYTACKYLALLGVFYISIMRIVSGTYNPFIYFQF